MLWPVTLKCLLKGQTVVKKIISVILILAGLGVLGLGVASGTVWKPEETVTLKTGQLDKALLVATNPGVVHQVNSQFKMTATAPDGGEVVVVAGRVQDVTGWIGNDAHWLVTGATTWEKLDTQFIAAKVDPLDEDTADDQADPKEKEGDKTPSDVSEIAALPNSDMWYEVTKGKGTVTVEMDKVPDNIVFLAGSLEPGATSAPQISLTWDRDVPTPLMVPGILAGALLLAVGILLLIDSLRHTPSLAELEAQAEPLSEDALRAAKIADLRSETEPDAENQPETEPEPLSTSATRALAFAPKPLPTEDETVTDPATELDDESNIPAVESDVPILSTGDADQDTLAPQPALDWSNHEFAPVHHGSKIPDPETITADVEADAEPAQLQAADALETPDNTKPATSLWSKMFGKKQRTPNSPTPVQDTVALIPAPSAPDPDVTPAMVLATEPTAPQADEQDRTTQAALEAFAAMDEPDVTTGALQAAGLTRRQLREMRERKKLEEMRNIPTTTGSLDFGAGAAAPSPTPERPSWLPQGTDSTSASSWRAAWGVRGAGQDETDTAPAVETAAPQEPAAPEKFAPSQATPEPDASEPDAPQAKMSAPTTRKALYRAYRAAAEKLENDEAQEDQSK